MELTWYGLGCFRLVERGYPAIVTDPFDADECGLSLPALRAEVVLSSTLLEEPERARWKGLRNVNRTLGGPGEYEIGGIFFTGVASFKDRKQEVQNIIYTITLNGVSVCYLGELGHAPTQAQIEALGPIQVLLLPVGIPEGLTPALASEVVSLIEPDIVIPMNYHTSGLRLERNPVSRFLKEMGMAEVEPVTSLKISAGGAVEETQVILLEPQK